MNGIPSRQRVARTIIALAWIGMCARCTAPPGSIDATSDGADGAARNDSITSDRDRGEDALDDRAGNDVRVMDDGAGSDADASDDATSDDATDARAPEIDAASDDGSLLDGAMESAIDVHGDGTVVDEREDVSTDARTDTEVTLDSGALDTGVDVSCPTGFERCAGVCRDTRSDAMHCGRCDNACGAGRECSVSACRATFASTPAATPALIAGTTACRLVDDVAGDQMDIARDGTVWLLLRCGADLRVARSIDGARTFSTNTVAPLPMTLRPVVATILGRDERTATVAFGATGALASVTQSTDGGARWSAPVTVTTTLIDSYAALPASISLVEHDGLLFEAHSHASAVLRVWASNLDTSSSRQFVARSTLEAIGHVDLFALAPMQVMAVVGPTLQTLTGFSAGLWTSVTLGGGDAFGANEFALGAQQLYGCTVQIRALTRYSLNSFGAVTARTPLGPCAQRNFSMDADPSGNLALAAQRSATTIESLFWRASATMPESTMWSVATAVDAVPATAAIPYIAGSVTAVATTAGVAVSVIVR